MAPGALARAGALAGPVAPPEPAQALQSNLFLVLGFLLYTVLVFWAGLRCGRGGGEAQPLRTRSRRGSSPRPVAEGFARKRA